MWSTSTRHSAEIRVRVVAPVRGRGQPLSANLPNTGAIPRNIGARSAAVNPRIFGGCALAVVFASLCSVLRRAWCPIDGGLSGLTVPLTPTLSLRKEGKGDPAHHLLVAMLRRFAVAAIELPQSWRGAGWLCGPGSADRCKPCCRENVPRRGPRFRPRCARHAPR